MGFLKWKPRLLICIDVGEQRTECPLPQEVADKERWAIFHCRCHCCEFLQCFDTVGSVTLIDYVKSLTVKIAYGMYCDSLVWCENVFLAHTNGFDSVMSIVRS